MKNNIIVTTKNNSVKGRLVIFTKDNEKQFFVVSDDEPIDPKKDKHVIWEKVWGKPTEPELYEIIGQTDKGTSLVSPDNRTVCKSDCVKILVYPEQFSIDIKAEIFLNKLKNGDYVYVVCETKFICPNGDIVDYNFDCERPIKVVKIHKHEANIHLITWSQIFSEWCNSCDKNFERMHDSTMFSVWLEQNYTIPTLK